MYCTAIYSSTLVSFATHHHHHNSHRTTKTTVHIHALLILPFIHCMIIFILFSSVFQQAAAGPSALQFSSSSFILDDDFMIRRIQHDNVSAGSLTINHHISALHPASTSHTGLLSSSSSSSSSAPFLPVFSVEP
mmetsp:Transcript_25467/g.37233  ORF Transcript_25467/g.37233 Transcript_25467/m.37233 type:complete len:134 (-) Transcript_25467:1014-1415(-)